MRCPRCQAAKVLKPVSYAEGGVTAEGHQCPKCKGHFFDRKQYGAIAAVPTQESVSFSKLPDAHAQLVPLRCPGCDTEDTMVKAQAKKEQRVTIDMCLSCGGIWLDGGELEAIRGEASSVFDAAKRWFSGD
jgi:Zn-finger nucleic acid-binding protein